MTARAFVVVWSVIGVGAAWCGAQAPPTLAEVPPTADGRLMVTPGQALEVIKRDLEAGLLLEDIQRRTTAIQTVRAILEGQPEDVEAKLLAGELLMLPGGEDFEAARRYFQQVLQTEPKNFRANLGMGRIWLETNYWRQADNFLKDAEAVAPEKRRVEVLQLRARALLGAGNTREALEKAEEALRADVEKTADSYRTLALVAASIAQRDPAQAQAALKQAAQYVQRAAELARERPWERRRVRELLNAYDMQIATLTLYYQSLCERDLRNNVLDRVKRGNEAAAAGALAQRSERMRLRAAVAAMDAEHEALVLLERAVELQPTSVPVLEEYAAALARVQDRERATRVYERIRELDPQNAAAAQYLGAAPVAPAAPPTGG